MSFQLNGFVRLLLLNVLLPFSGFLYTLYICYYYLPRELAKRTGLPVPPGPFKLYVEPHLKPYSDKLRAAMWEKLKSLTSTEDQDKRL
ncbi:MAG: hypothetical protein GC134_04500 [Proteobacteria bacterium]|nr:hypothetical protein [Pseudomonadota bacterium]